MPINSIRKENRAKVKSITLAANRQLVKGLVSSGSHCAMGPASEVPLVSIFRGLDCRIDIKNRSGEWIFRIGRKLVWTVGNEQYCGFSK